LHKSLSAPKESDITVASANLQIDEVSDSVIVQSTWPKIFTICSENLTIDINKFFPSFIKSLYDYVILNIK
jgi:hypothetical protein